MKMWPNGNPVGRKKGDWTPGQYETSRVMSAFLSKYLGIAKPTIASEFSRQKKSLANIQDCVKFLKARLEK